MKKKHTTMHPRTRKSARSARSDRSDRSVRSARSNPQSPRSFLPFTRPTIDDETIAGVSEVLRSGWITSGPQVKALEAALSQLFGGRPVRAFNSGTCTMEIALRIAGIGAGDEVITTPLTWVATSNVILETGARPVFVDIDPRTRNIDLDRAEAAITPRTKAIIPVDLAGLPVDRDRLHAIAKKHNLRVIEDAAQSIGARWRGQLIGSKAASPDIASFSFHPNKNITTIEGGCLVLNDEREARLAEQYRLQGVIRTGYDGMDVELLGGKFNLTDVAARVGLGQLKRLDEFNTARRALARHYFKHFAAAGVGSAATPPAEAIVNREPKTVNLAPTLGLPPADFENSNWHMFQVVLPEGDGCLTRAQVMEKMHAAGIGTGVHYPPVHLFTMYRNLGWNPGDFPNAERTGRAILTLPLFPAMTESDVERAVTTLVEILK
jgi:dTDP-4-amino-4,6-dideoxygalactose transaminase